LWKSECLGSDPKLDPKLFTSRIRIRIHNFFLDPDPKLGGKWDPDPKKIVTDLQHCCRFTESNYGYTKPGFLCKSLKKSYYYFHVLSRFWKQVFIEAVKKQNIAGAEIIWPYLLLNFHFFKFFLKLRLIERAIWNVPVRMSTVQYLSP
jgi:hypothetical protein